jgi:DNA-binding response OmpR family regulator
VNAEQLVEASLGRDESPGVNVIQVMVCNLRKKLASEGEDAVVKTRRGYGYYVE